ncbi:Protein CMSS1 [Bienertia sinuspersici]
MAKGKVVGSKKREALKSGKLHQKPHAPIKKPKTNSPNKKNKKIGLEKNSIDNDLKLEKPNNGLVTPQFVSPLQHCKFFVEQFESANGTKFSSLELESIKDSYFIKLSEGISQDSDNLGQHVKNIFGSSWKEMLCEPQLVKGKVDPGNPAVLVISASAIRSLEMLRGLRILTKECQAVKLFSKHLKIDDQVTLCTSTFNC